jgi:hypothetical protein
MNKTEYYNNKSDTWYLLLLDKRHQECLLMLCRQVLVQNATFSVVALQKKGSNTHMHLLSGRSRVFVQKLLDPCLKLILHRLQVKREKPQFVADANQVAVGSEIWNLGRFHPFVEALAVFLPLRLVEGVVFGHRVQSCQNPFHAVDVPMVDTMSSNVQTSYIYAS